ncbi:uncharacterized protein LOC143150424 [Ptiloglossa arizonensis]|uniref:uncharacterized protein LOC143150424 n=1 Tax=Ptiloglossa arizonensis TaxID=3350558 RepID=UPI003FA1744D
MFSLRQVFQLGIRLTFVRKPVNLHRISLISKDKFDVNNIHQNIFVRMKTNLCESSQEEDDKAKNKMLGKVEGKLKLYFTCKRCNSRTSKIISKIAYEKGIVIVRCDGCKNNHLIADHLGWFPEMKKFNNIEKYLASKGESVRRVLNDVDGYVEIVVKEEFDMIHGLNRKPLNDKKSETCIENKKNGTSEDT